MSGRVITEKEFNIMKKLTNNGVSQKEFFEATGRKHATYSRVKHCESFKEYQDYVAKSSGWDYESKQYKKKPEKGEEKQEKAKSRRDEIMEHYTEIAHHLMLLGRLLGEE